MSLESKPCKVVWHDGTLLMPHHFQQADRYLESQLRLSAQAQSPLGWGVLSLAWNEPELGLGRLGLVSCRGLLGETERVPVDIPAVDPLPAPVVIPADADTLDVFLTLAPEETTRWGAPAARCFTDLYSARSEEIMVTAKNFSLCVDTRPPEKPHLHLGQVVRRRGELTLRADFIPPSLTLVAPVVARLRELLSAIGGQRRDLESALTQRQLKEAQPFYLFALEQQEPVLWHMLHSAQSVHPSALFQELLRLAGGIRMSAPGYSLLKAELKYEHGNPDGCFRALFAALTELLAQRPAPRSAGELLEPLSREPTNMRWAGRIAVQPGHRYFMVLPAGLSVTSRGLVEKRCRISRPEDLDDQVGGTQGLRLIARDRDSGLPAELGEAGTYFEVDTDSQIWRDISRDGRIAVYVLRNLFESTAPSVRIVSVARGAQ